MKLFSRLNCSLFSLLTAVSAIFIIFSLSFSISGCSKKKEELEVKEVARPVKFLTVEGKSSGKEVKYPGRVRASQRVDLAFQVTGPLIELPVTEGQNVKKGEIIARILPRDFETEIAKAKAKALDAEQQFQRYRDLYVKKQVSKADFDKYKSQADIAKARQKETEDTLSDTYLRAPFTGVIAKRYVENFEDVQAKAPIVSIQDISEIEVLVDVPESVMVTLKQGAKKVAVAEFAAAPGKQYPLSLKEYSTEADPRTLTYQVTLLMTQPEDITVLPGMTANVIGTTETDQTEVTTSIITIPAAAVFADETGSSHVWTVNRETMTVNSRQVETGSLTGAADISIISGIEPGETIAVTGVTQLRENMKVSNLADQEGYSR
ncbi:MAG: efflux RND transporter periplasmic adaptor subunit [Desulfobacterales bacterium]|nr:efflux RND transporter periplasmic adaptor subunit [Desulfobacterales bacterium]